MNFYNNILELIGNTPLVRINKLLTNKDVMLLAKLERFNPCGSVKERIAFNMIKKAEEQGILTRDKIIIEASSGNTGIGLALVCAVKDYDLEIVLDGSQSIERRKILTAYGAKITLTDAEKGTNGAIDYVNKMIEEQPDRYVNLNQFGNVNNPLTHYECTAEEILRDTDGKVDTFIAGLGTSGTLMGVSRRLKELNPETKIIAVIPEENSEIPGLKDLSKSYVPEILNESLINDMVEVSMEEAEEATRNLVIYEGIFAGLSSGAAMHVALKEAEMSKKGTIVVLLPDGGEKYISYPIFTPQKFWECKKSCNPNALWDDEYVKEISKWWDNPE